MTSAAVLDITNRPSRTLISGAPQSGAPTLAYQVSGEYSRDPQDHVAVAFAGAAHGRSRSTTAGASQISFWPCSSASDSKATLLSGSVRAIASKASTLIAMRTIKSTRRPSGAAPSPSFRSRPAVRSGRRETFSPREAGGLVAADDHVDVERIELDAAAYATGRLRGDEGRAGPEERVDNNVAAAGKVAECVLEAWRSA